MPDESILRTGLGFSDGKRDKSSVESRLRGSLLSPWYECFIYLLMLVYVEVFVKKEEILVKNIDLLY